MSSRHRRSLTLALLGGLLLCGPVRAQEKPSDDRTLRVEYMANVDIEASQILASWGRFFGALVIQDPQVIQTRIKFLTNVNTDLSWGAVKLILDFHDVVVVESQPTPNGPWVIRAHHRRNLPTKEPPPWRYVESKDVPDHDELVTAVFQIKNGAGNNIFATLRGFGARDMNRVGNMLYVPGPEIIIVVDLASKVRYYGRLIEALDSPGPRKEMQVFQIVNAPVQDLANVLTTVLQTLGGGSGGGAQPGQVVVAAGAPGQAAPATVIADPRSNKLIIAVFPIDLPLVRRVIEEMDVRVAPPGGRFHVYQCHDADAEYLAGKVQELFTGQRPAGSGQAGGRPAGTRPPGQQGAQVTAQTPGGSASVTLGDGGGVGDVETRIVADERTNSLLIQAEEGVYRQILAVLNELDKKRRRVMIEAEVWEVFTPTDQLTIGFELITLTNAHEGSIRPAAATSFGLSQTQINTDANGNATSIGRVPNLATGLTAILTKDTFDKLPIIMNAVHNFEEARLITRPFAITNDNTPSTFAISNRQPFLTTTVNNVASQQNVQFVDANSTLTIEPQVNSEDNLTLKLTLEITSFSGSGSATLPPGTNSRRYEGEVTVANNRYAVFGGLESETDRTVENKIPFIGDIPILGHLFKTWTRAKTKTKVWIFIRPTIFSDSKFTGETRLSSALREKVHIEAQRDDWLPPIVPDRYLRPPGYDLQDEAFEIFGTGSADPLMGTAGASSPATSE